MGLFFFHSLNTTIVNKSTRILAVISMLSLVGIIVILAFSALSVNMAIVTFFGALTAISVIFYSYMELNKAIDKYEETL